MPAEETREIPVYIFTGFLEAGKTRFIRETLADKRFNPGERTLLICCEEGEEEIKTLLVALSDEAKYGAVIRAKGIVAAADDGKWLHFDFVPGESEIRRGAAGVTGRLCVIGAEIKADALKELFGV